MAKDIDAEKSLTVTDIFKGYEAEAQSVCGPRFFRITNSTQGSTDNFDHHQMELGSNDINLKWDIMWTSKT